MRNILLGSISLFCFWACTSNVEEKSPNPDSTGNSAMSSSNPVQTTQPDVVESNEHALTDKTTLQKSILLGKELSCVYTDIPARLKETMPGIMQAITENKAVITGSYHIVLTETPEPAKPIRIFIGIPVQKPVKAAGMSTYTLPAGNYLRHQCSAEPGLSLSVHRAILKAPYKKLKKNVGLPIIEKYAETRNDEMTSVVSKATFYYTLPQ